MRTAIIAIAIVVAVIFFGGAFNIGGAPIFGHIDDAIGTPIFMPLHYALFFYLDTGADSVRSGAQGVERDFRSFEKAPAGYDKHKQYRELDNAKEY